MRSQDMKREKQKLKNRNLRKQLAAILLLVVFFGAFDFGVYTLFTKKCVNNYSEGMQAKSIELNEYLPFDDASKIVKLDAETKLTGDLPVIDGAAALYPVFSAFFHAAYPKESCAFNGQDFTAESCLQMKNTRGAYKAVVDGDDDIIFCAKPSEEQLRYAKENGANLELIPIGYEAFVFLVNTENPVNNLTIDQIRGIYAGTYTNWFQLGGDSKPINALRRNEGSGSQTAMRSFMDGREIKRRPLSFLGSSIGFSFRYYVEGIVSDGGVKMLSVNGVYPDKENIAGGNYPITNNFYAVYRKDNKNPNIPILIDFILSKEGQKIIEESGYVPL